MAVEIPAHEFRLNTFTDDQSFCGGSLKIPHYWCSKCGGCIMEGCSKYSTHIDRSEIKTESKLHAFVLNVLTGDQGLCPGSLRTPHHWCGKCGGCNYVSCSKFSPHLNGAKLAKPKPQDRGGHPRFYQIIEEIAELHSKKNTDYAKGGQQGPLGNFHRTAKFLQMYPKFDWSRPPGVAIGYMLKQLDAALILYSSGRTSVTGEGIPERLKDVAVYALIAMILVEEESNESKKDALFSKDTFCDWPGGIFLDPQSK